MIFLALVALSVIVRSDHSEACATGGTRSGSDDELQKAIADKIRGNSNSGTGNQSNLDADTIKSLIDAYLSS